MANSSATCAIVHVATSLPVLASFVRSMLVMSVRMLYVYVNVKQVCRVASAPTRGPRPMFELSKDHEDFRAVVREFAQAEVAPYVAGWDRDHHFPADLIPKLGDLGNEVGREVMVAIPPG